MPYNNTPIAPPQETTGTVSLPLARVKKIIAADEDNIKTSNNAAFVIAVATEMFVQHMVEQVHNVVKSERRVRRNVQYKDVANAVARVDNLEFLADVVPQTMTYREYKKKKAREEERANEGHANGQQTLSSMRRPMPEDTEMVDLDNTHYANGNGNGNVTPHRTSRPNTATSPTASRGQTFDAIRDITED